MLKRILATVAILLGATAITSSIASAACVCRCVNGHMQALCSNTMELPPICPLTLCPLTPPSIRPLPSLRLPPLGTTHCAPQQVWNGYRYEWRTVCR